MVLTRPFRVALEVRGASEDQRRDGLLRVWEDVTPDAQMLLEAAEVLDVCEIYTGAEVDANKHKGGWELGARSPDWGACVGEGFVVVSAQKRRRPGAGAPRPYQVSHAPWSKEGTPDEPLFVLRREGTHFNHLNFPYYSAPLNLFNDAFSAWSKLNKVRSGKVSPRDSAIHRGLRGTEMHPREYLRTYCCRFRTQRPRRVASFCPFPIFIFFPAAQCRGNLCGVGMADQRCAETQAADACRNHSKPRRLSPGRNRDAMRDIGRASEGMYRSIPEPTPRRTHDATAGTESAVDDLARR